MNVARGRTRGALFCAAAIVLAACGEDAGEDELRLRPRATAADAAGDGSRDAAAHLRPDAGAFSGTPPAGVDAGCTPSVPHDPGALDPERTEILPLPEGEGLLQQCSRPTLPRVDGFWTPTEADVRALESALPAFFERPCQRHYFIVLDEYHAQYVGVVSAERRLIYASFVHENVFFERPDAGAPEPYVLCDGGVLAWGIAFDPATGDFEALEVNGSVEQL